MTSQGAHQTQSSRLQTPALGSLKLGEVAMQIFHARLLTDLEPREADLVLDIFAHTAKIHELLTDVQQIYHQNKARFVPDIALRQQIESMIQFALDVRSYTTYFFDVLRELAIDVDMIGGHGAFRIFMTSRFVRRFSQDIYEHQLDALSRLIDCKIKMNNRTSGRMVGDPGAEAHYMSCVITYFYREFKKYAIHLVTPKPTDEGIFKLREKVACSCFHSTKSLGALFAHAQFLRRKIEVIEESFRNAWMDLPIEEVNRMTRLFTFVRDSLHVTRGSAMVLIAFAMRFADDDEGFISYCREHEGTIARFADTLYIIQDRILQVSSTLTRLRNDCGVEKHRHVVLSLSVDPIEKYVRQLDVRLVQETCSVFLGHDGSEDCTGLANYLHSEIQSRRISCYMEGFDFDASEKVMSDQTERALDDASVGVFLLTPEFAKKEKTTSQLRHMIHRTRKARVGWPGPTIIPVFFEVSITDCRRGNIFGEASESANVDISTDIDKDVVKNAFHYVTRYTGIENLEGAKLEQSEEMRESCRKLMKRTADGVAEVFTTALKEHEEHTQQDRKNKISDDRKKRLADLSSIVTMYRELQRKAREESILCREKDPFRIT